MGFTKTINIRKAANGKMKNHSVWFEARYSDNVKLSLRLKEWIYSTQSEFQKIDVMDSFDFGRLLVLDDIINVTTSDEFIYHEMMAHVPLFSHPDPKNILVVGGGDGGVIREIMKHKSVKKAYLVEIDSQVVEVSKKYFPDLSIGLDDHRVNVVYDDASKFVNLKKGKFDIIIIDSTDPIGAGERLFTPDFYTNCFSSLNDYGILTAQSESPFFDPDILKLLYGIAKNIFPVVKMYIAFVPSYVSGIWSFLFCSKHFNPIENFQSSRFDQTRIEMRYYNSEIHKASFSLPSFIKKQFDL